MAAPAKEIPVDGGRDLRRQRISGDGDDPETKSGNTGEAQARVFEQISKNIGPWYIYQVVVGGTEWNSLVTPRCKTTCSCCNSVRPSCSNQWHQGENLDQHSCFCWEPLHGKQKKFSTHAMIYPWRCIARRGRVCLRTLVDRKQKRFTTQLM